MAAEEPQQHVIYEPLDTQQNQFRLIKLQDSEPGKIAFTMETHMVGDCPYECLSYTWGSDTDPQSIELNNQPFPVSKNLFQFLEAYTVWDRTKHLDHLWIDQICIDQNCSQERNHQVQHMAEIYKGATKVLAWLGESDDMKRSLEIVQIVQENADYRGWDEERTKLLLNEYAVICSAPYWSRLWVVQEFILARNLSILCSDGQHSILAVSSDCLANLYRLVPPDWAPASHSNTSFSDSLYVRTIMRADNDVKFFLADLLDTFMHRECKDPRDHVFALTGLALDRQQVTVDYTMSNIQVFLHAVSLEKRRPRGRRRYPLFVFRLAKAMNVFEEAPELEARFEHEYQSVKNEPGWLITCKEWVRDFEDRVLKAVETLGK